MTSTFAPAICFEYYYETRITDTLAMIATSDSFEISKFQPGFFTLKIGKVLNLISGVLFDFKRSLSDAEIFYFFFKISFRNCVCTIN